MTLTTEQVIEILIDATTGREPSVTGQEADELREAILKDIEKAKEQGYSIRVPSEWEVEGAIGDTVAKGGPGSGCNPEVGTCGRPSTGESNSGIKSLVDEHIQIYNTGEKTFTPIKFPDGLTFDNLKGAQDELKSKRVLGLATGKYKFLYNPESNDVVAFPFAREHGNIFDENKKSLALTGEIDTNWSRMEYSKDMDGTPVLELDYWHGQEMDDPKYQNYMNTLSGVISNKTFPDNVELHTWEVRSGFKQNRTLGEWRETFKFEKGGPGSGCTGINCGRPKTSNLAFKTNRPQAFSFNEKDPVSTLSTRFKKPIDKFVVTEDNEFIPVHYDEPHGVALTDNKVKNFDSTTRVIQDLPRKVAFFRMGYPDKDILNSAIIDGNEKAMNQILSHQKGIADNLYAKHPGMTVILGSGGLPRVHSNNLPRDIDNGFEIPDKPERLVDKRFTHRING